MLPIKDHTPSGKIPILNFLLLGINIAVFFFMFGMSEPGLEMFVNQYALIPNLVVNGQNLYTLVTSMFFHGSLGHLFGNMLFLYIFGDNLEDRLGSIKYLFFYILVGLGATALQIFLNPASGIPNLGASGAIAGIMGGYLVLFPRHGIDVLVFFGFVVRIITVPAYTMLLYWFLFQFLAGLGTIGIAETGGIAYGAHVGGFVTGVVLLLLLRGAGGVRRASIEMSG